MYVENANGIFRFKITITNAVHSKQLDKSRSKCMLYICGFLSSKCISVEHFIAFSTEMVLKMYMCAVHCAATTFN